MHIAVRLSGTCSQDLQTAGGVVIVSRQYLNLPPACIINSMGGATAMEHFAIALSSHR